MDIIRCFHSNCMTKPQAYCDCSGYPLLFCERHCFDHLQLLDSNSHKFINLWCTPSEESRQIIISKANELKCDVKIAKKYLMSEYIKINRCLEDYIDQSFSILKGIEIKANEFIKAASCIAQVPTYSNVNDYQLILRLKPSEIRNRASTWKISNDWLKTKHLLDSIKDSFEFFKIAPYKEICGNYNSLESIFFICGDHIKELSEFNLRKQTLIKHKLEISEGVWNNVSLCLLPNRNIFFYGNYIGHSSHTGLTFLINEEKKVTKLPTGKANCDLSSVLYGNHIYSFGGLKRTSEKFCLKKNTWKSCCSLPEGDYQFSTTIIFCDILLLARLHSTALWQYEIRKDSFKRVPNLELARDIHKRLFTGNSRCYIIETSQKIYESEELNPMKWKTIGSNSIKDAWIWSFGAYYDNCIWFINWECDLIKFNLRTKKLDFIRKI